MLCAEQESLLDELLSGELNTLITADGALNVAPLKVMSPVRRAALIRRWLAYHRAVMPSGDAQPYLGGSCTGEGRCRTVYTPEWL